MLTRHLWVNRLQTLLMIATLLLVCSLAGSLLFGEQGVWMTLAIASSILLLQAGVSRRLTLHLYRGRPPILPHEAPVRIAQDLGGIGDAPRIAQCTNSLLCSQPIDQRLRGQPVVTVGSP